MPARRLARFTIRRCLTTTFAAVLLLLLLTGTLWSRTGATPSTQQSSPSSSAPNQPATSQKPNGSGTTQVPGAGVTVQNQQPQTGSDQTSEQPEPQTRITKNQAKELFRSVDEILDFVSQDTGLPIEHQVKHHLLTREEVEKYVDKRMKDD
ncbi:MAG: hypothetical protein ABSD98_00960, partial [Candidatus Korobacteraceae bacterium]